jgi:hypothetical protein
VYLKVPPMRGPRHFKVQGKLAPRFIGPFKIIEKRGDIAYQLELPPQLSDVHAIFHASQLKNYLRVPKEQVPLEHMNESEDLTYQEYPIKIVLRPPKESPRTKGSEGARFNGATIQNSKLHGKEKNN